MYSFYKEIIYAKINHQLDILKIIDQSSQDQLENYLFQLKDSTEFQALDALEAVSARVYFKALFGKDFKRTDENMINAGLNYGYAIIRSMIMHVIVAKGLHPSIGIHHHSQFNNYNLADDLIEVYRPLVDYLVFQFIKSHETFDKHFKIKMQHVLKQLVLFEGKEVFIKQSIIYYIEHLKAYSINREMKILMPQLRVELYDI